MRLNIINLLPESSHARVIDEADTTHRITDVVWGWCHNEPSVGYHSVTDGSYLYSRSYWDDNKKAILVGDIVDNKKVLYDYTDHFLYDNRNIKLDDRRHALRDVCLARNEIVRMLNYRLPPDSCVRFELCRTRHRKSSNCSGFQIRFHRTPRRIIKTHNLFDVYKYNDFPYLRSKEFDAIFLALDKEPKIVKPKCTSVTVKPE
jgi:hypothetical protein